MPADRSLFPVSAGIQDPWFRLLFWLAPLFLVACQQSEPPNTFQWERNWQRADQYILQGQYGEARSLLQDTVAMAKLHQRKGPQYARGLQQLADLFRRQGEFRKAEMFLWESLPIWAQSVGPEHPNMASGLKQLASLFHDQREDQKARPLLERAIAIEEKHFGVDHPQLLTTLEQYHGVLESLHRPVEARAVRERITRIEPALP